MSPLHYAQGIRGLDGQPIPTQAGPPPAPPARPAEPRAQAVSPALPAPQAPYADIPAYTITLDDRDSGLSISAKGDTLEEAIADAHQKYEAAQPIQILTWASGKPVEGLAREMLLDGLEMVEARLSGQGAAPVVMVMLGRLRASLGQGDQQQ